MEFVQMFVPQSRVIYDRVQSRKKYFEIAALLNFERGTSRARNSNENKTQTNTVAVKCNTTLNFPAFQLISSFNWQKGGNFKIIFPVSYPIIYNPASMLKSTFLESYSKLCLEKTLVLASLGTASFSIFFFKKHWFQPLR